MIDDGSVDDTKHALKRFSSQIRYVRQENQGLNAARNRALELAEGEYVALLDSDDLWCGFKLGLEVSVLDAFPDLGFVFSDFWIMKPGGKNINNGLHTWFSSTPIWSDIFSSAKEWDLSEIPGADETNQDTVSVYTGDIYHTSLFGPRVLPSASLFRKSKAAGWLRFNEQDSYCGDWEFFARLSHRHGAAFIDMETAFNRSHEDAVRLTRADYRLQIAKRLDMIDRIWKQDDAFYRQYKTEVDEQLTKFWGQMLKLHLKAGCVDEARKAIDELNKLDAIKQDAQLSLYKALAYTPGIALFLPMLLALRKKLD